MNINYCITEQKEPTDIRLTKVMVVYSNYWTWKTFDKAKHWKQ